MMVKVIPCLCVLAAGCATEEAVQPEVAVSLLTGVSGGAGIVPAPDSGSQYLGSDGE